MDRFTFTDESSFQPGRVVLDIEFAAGSSGAVPTALSGYTRKAGIASMDLAATGVYTVHLSDVYQGLIGASFSVEQASYDATHACAGDVIDSDVSDSPDPLVTFQAFNNSAGAAAAVTSGDIVRITLVLQRLHAV
jgi:hypothetical protein